MIRQDLHWMELALQQAELAARRNEVPVGAVLVRDNQLIASDGNRCIELNDATAHAEIQLIRQAGVKTGNYRLPGTTLYVTLEPCTMCVGAIIHARIQRLVFGAIDYKAGAVCGQSPILNQSFHNHKVVWIGGFMEGPCKLLLQTFFKQKRV